ncbi:hypothetical protein NDU88_006812 [Pleurodeles waltl]|uniref:Uncharacterized protein n=1 Tax=Pleurodeles waltl TaxID=8319 RepID=A0AAV7QK45_PLEWA|nr:hypothetical protein NDU88_006812 [Pleurodeles waltl]
MPPVGALALLGPVCPAREETEARRPEDAPPGGPLECSSCPCGRACYPWLMRLGWESSEVSSRRPQWLSPASRVPRSLRSRPAGSSTRHAGSDPVSAPPPTGVQRPLSPAPCAVAPSTPALDLNARLRGRGAATWRHPGYFWSRQRGPDGRTFGPYRL